MNGSGLGPAETDQVSDGKDNQLSERLNNIKTEAGALL